MNITSCIDFSKDGIFGIDIGSKYITLTKCDKSGENIKVSKIESDLNEKHWLYIL